MVLSNTSMAKCHLCASLNAILIFKKYFLLRKIKRKKTPINLYKLVLIHREKKIQETPM